MKGKALEIAELLVLLVFIAAAYSVRAGLPLSEVQDDGTYVYADEFMSGGNESAVLGCIGLLCIPAATLSAIRLRKRTRALERAQYIWYALMLVCVIYARFFMLDYTHILLCLRYGTTAFKIYILSGMMIVLIKIVQAVLWYKGKKAPHIATMQQ